MKKVISIFLIFLMCLVTLPISVYASGKDSINLKCETEQTANDQVNVKLYTGDFEGVSENTNLTITIDIEYTAEDISLVTAQGVNNWHVDIDLENNKIVYTTDKPTANSELGTITIMLRTTSSNSSGIFNLKSVIATGDNEFLEDYGSIPVNYTIATEPDDGEKPGENETTGDNETSEDNQNSNNNQNNYSNTNNQNNSTDNTVASGKLPDTGWNCIMFGGIILIIVMIYGYIKYKRFE